MHSTWVAFSASGIKFTGDRVSYTGVDRDEVSLFQIVKGQAVLFQTRLPPRAYRRRVSIMPPNPEKVCHILVFASDDIVFVFEETGEVVHKTAFEPGTQWFYPIKE